MCKKKAINFFVKLCSAFLFFAPLSGMEKTIEAIKKSDYESAKKELPAFPSDQDKVDVLCHLCARIQPYWPNLKIILLGYYHKDNKSNKNFPLLPKEIFKEIVQWTFSEQISFNHKKVLGFLDYLKKTKGWELWRQLNHENRNEQSVYYKKFPLQIILEAQPWNIRFLNVIKEKFWFEYKGFHLTVAFAEKSNPLAQHIIDKIHPSDLNTDLRACIFAKKFEYIAFCINNGAKPNQKYLVEASFEGKTDVVTSLINSGYNINTLDNRITPLMAACKTSNLELTQFLVEKGADLDIFDHVSDTAFMFACKAGALKLVEFLIAKGCDVNYKNVLKETPLMYACRSGNKNVVTFLVKNGANVSAKNDDGQTARMIANNLGHLEITLYLKRKELINCSVM